MSLWRQLSRAFRTLTHRTASDQDVADEVSHFLEQTAASHVARGLSPDAALRAARIEMGGETATREQVRGYGWENLVERTLSDIRYALRRLRRNPGFTAVIVLTLGLGVGGTTAIFSAVNPILFEPLPYPEPDRVASLWEISNQGERVEGTFGMYQALAERNRSFESLAAYRIWQPTLTGLEQPERLIGQRVSASYFSALGATPALGRDFAAAEDQANGPGVVVLSDALWRRRFGGDRTIIGRQITLEGVPYSVIGVMPPEFENVLSPSAEIWSPLQYDIAEGRAWGHHLRTVGRLREDIDLETATTEANQLGAAVLAEQHPETYGDSVSFLASSLHADIIRGVRPALLAILGAVALVLVIACVNVTNLLLAKGVERRAEFALRAALGGEHARLIRQLLTENLVLVLLGGVVGMVVAFLGVRSIVRLSPADLPRVGAISVDAAVFGFGLLITTLIGLTFGLVPALRTARSNPQHSLGHGTRRTTGGHKRTRSILVIAEVALALILLVGCGLLFRSMERLFAVEAGFNPAGILTAQVQASGQRFSDDSSTFRFFAQALEAVRQIPGVTQAALTSQLPLSGDDDLYGARFEPPLTNDPGEVNGTFRYGVSPGYLETMGIPVRSGRSLNEQDDADAPPVVVISESMARRRLPGRDPIGLRLTVGGGTLYTIVGVVGDVKQLSLAGNETDAVYMNVNQWRFADNVMTVVVQARDKPEALGPAIRQAIWTVDKDQPIVRIATMETLVKASAAERRFALVVFEVFALVALVMAAAGIYGVLSGSVAERTREIGVRSALGASRGSILGLVLRQALHLTGIGVILGLIGAVRASQAIGAMLFGVSPLDVVTYAGVVGLLLAVSLIASAIPAWRAARVDPATTLRSE